MQLQQSTETLDADGLTLMEKGQREWSLLPGIVAIVPHLDSLGGRKAGGAVIKVKPMGMLLMMLAGWINRQQQDVIVSNPCVAGSGYRKRTQSQGRDQHVSIRSSLLTP